jgi:CubicO group peptidase (beta-lactamase class C family)
MLTERAATGQDEEARGYGYGWFVGTRSGHAWFHHSGDNAGFKAFAACIPELDVRIALLTDTDATDPATVRALLNDALAVNGRT